MRASLVCVTIFLLAPVFAAPIQTPTARGIAQEIENTAKLVFTKFKLINVLPGALKRLKLAKWSTLTLKDADALMLAAEKGDARVISALENFSKDVRAGKVELTDATKSLNDRFHVEVLANEEGTWLASQLKANKLDATLFKAQTAFNKKWSVLPLRAKVAIITGGVLGTGAVLALALELHDMHKASVLPTSFTEEHMAQLESFIQANPEKYEGLMQDISTNVPDITVEQQQRLVDLAPQSVLDHKAEDAATATKRSLVELD